MLSGEGTAKQGELQQRHSIDKYGLAKEQFRIGLQRNRMVLARRGIELYRIAKEEFRSVLLGLKKPN